MIIYIDNDYKCHVENDGTMIEVEVDFFDGKCAEFIEGYRYIPSGESWINNGITYNGEAISPWKPYFQLLKAQLTYEKELSEAALGILIGE